MQIATQWQPSYTPEPRRKRVGLSETSLGALPLNQPKPTMKTPAKKIKAPSQYTDLAALQITNDAMPASRCAPMHKYHAVFERMHFGQCVRCATEDVGKVSGAMRKYLEIKRKTALVRTVMRYTDPKTGVEDGGFGRVWMMAAGK